jgi:peptide/nickel transport system permease protein
MKGEEMFSFYVLGRIARAFFTVIIVITFVFMILRLSGDPTVAVLGLDASTEAVEAFREKWGLNDPLYIQYYHFIRNAAKGDLGLSIIEEKSALSIVLSRLNATLILMAISTFLTFAFGILLGLVASFYHNSNKDRAIMIFSVIGYSMPTFIVGILLVMLFSVNLGWLPSAGYGTWKHYIMPILTMTFVEAAVFARFTRSAMLEVLYQPYIKTAMAKGLTWWQTIKNHALKNAAIPIVTICGFWIGLIIAGAVITESIFGWPGIGRLLVFSVRRRDYGVVQVIVMLISCSMAITNLFVDIIYGYLDPRVSLSRRTE